MSSQPSIALNNFQRQWELVRSAAHEALEEVGASGFYILGQQVSAFERELASACRAKHAIGVGNGLDAIEIALRALGLQPGDKVLTTPISAFATTLAIVRAGGIPVFVDTDKNGNIDLERCDQALRSDETIRFLVPVHLYGNPLSLKALNHLKATYAPRLRIIEDCAQAILAEYDNQMVGSVGHAATVSFYPTKNLGAIGGDAGAAWTSDPDLAKRMQSLRNYGQSQQYSHCDLGMNSRLDELHAAILRRLLGNMLHQFTARRSQIAQSYLTAFAPHHRTVQALQVPEAARPVWHLFPLFLSDIERREAVAAKFRDQGVAVGWHYPAVIPDQPVMREVKFACLDDLKTARQLTAAQLSLPIHPFLTDDEVAKVIEIGNAIL